VAPRLAHLPALWPQTPPCFLACGVGDMGAAPATPQDQGLVTSRLLATRLPLAPIVPQTTVRSLPRPIVYCAHMSWLPEGSCVPLAHGRGVARLHPPVAGHRSWVGVGTQQTAWVQTILPPRLSPHPPWGLNLSPRLYGQQRARGLAACHNTPVPVCGPPPSARSAGGSWPVAVGKTAARSDCNGWHPEPLP
jgi:hypothetical protein